MFQTQSMNLDLVRTFVIVCQSKDYIDAASKLKIDATNVSRHIKNLEQLMGTKLINKKSKNYIELTEDGKTLFEKLYHYNVDFVIDEKVDNIKKSSGIKMIDIGVSIDI